MRGFATVAVIPLFITSLSGAVSPQRSFVSTEGSDANAATGCSLVAPCRSFGAAIGAVVEDGEVIALDSGGYGRFDVTKSVTVSAPPGVYAGISVFSGTNGVDINTPGVVVILRGLTINGQGGTHGIFFQSGASLLVENCVVGSMLGNGIRIVAAGSSNVVPSQTSIVGTTLTRNSAGIHLDGGPATVTVSRSNVVSNNIGIEARGTLDTVNSTIEIADTTVANNNNGVLASVDVPGATIDAIVTGSVLSSNVNNGIYGSAVTGGTLLVTATGNAIVRNFNGVSADGPGTTKIVLGQNTITRQRQLGVSAVTPVLSRGDNTISDNVSFDVFGGPMGALGGL
jgi:Right handed beta helix region